MKTPLKWYGHMSQSKRNITTRSRNYKWYWLQHKVQRWINMINK